MLNAGRGNPNWIATTPGGFFSPWACLDWKNANVPTICPVAWQAFLKRKGSPGAL